MNILMNLEYRGWIDIRLCENQHEFTIKGSFLSDFIHDISNRISTLTEGAKEVIIRVQAEPGEYRILIINSGDNCFVKVYEFDDNFSSDDLTQGNIVFSASIDMSLLLQGFYNEITRLKELGEKEYHRIWGYEFPIEAYQRLKRSCSKTRK